METVNGEIEMTTDRAIIITARPRIHSELTSNDRSPSGSALPTAVHIAADASRR